MSASTALDPSLAKPRRRPATKAVGRQGDKPVKIGLYLSTEAARRLGITATMEHSDKSAIVDALINTHLRKYVVSVRGDRTAPAEATLTSELIGEEMAA